MKQTRAKGHTNRVDQGPPATNRSELVIGLVVPTGTDLKNFKEWLKSYLENFHYQTAFYRLSEFLQDPEAKKAHGVKIEESKAKDGLSEFERIQSLMDAGDALRSRTSRGDVLALYTAANIRESRGQDPTIRPAVVHVLHSLKHPDEAETLRQIYGAGFFLLGLHRSEEARCDYIKSISHLKDDEVKVLFTRDQNGSGDYGQKTRATFELADAFINLDDEKAAHAQLNRIIDLLFGNPFHTPTLSEHAMFLAYAASFSSSDLSRQVGAVVVSKEREVLALGMNEVPRPGGGRYFAEDEPDRRDFQLGYDSNSKKREEFIESVFKIVGSAEYLSTEARDELRMLLRNNFSPTEFGRPVHAEMSALLSCARLGVSPHNGTLYATTFPCHNCAKHIVEAGILRVIYVEPYPKSLAFELHNDAIVLGPVAEEDSAGKVIFEPFVGIAARHYVDLFSLKLSSGTSVERKQDSFHKLEWKPDTAVPRLRMTDTTYIEREDYFARQLITIRSNATTEKN